MTLIDLVSIATGAACGYTLVRWIISMRAWPLTLAVVIAMLSNIAFYVSRAAGWFTPTELNLFSAVRVLLTVLIVAAIPSTVRRDI